ncbi:MAG: hypothetical protein HY596_02565, partial [Candidatus Omnitrophica bacterium]|nr:hypothetical protein [Candidatus Omnitrophota bacterium]
PIDPYFRDAGGVVHTLSNPLTIVSGLVNTPNASTTYPWPVPDKASTTVVVRVVNPADSAVVKDSPTFKIQGSMTVTYPNAANTVLVVNSPETITWNKTGSSILRAKVSYSLNGLAGPWTPIIESEEGTNNDGIVTNDGSVPWTVPDLLAQPTLGLPKTNVMIKIEDPNDSAVSDPSDNAFKVRGNLAFVTPAGSDRWVTNESRIVSWNTTGSITATNLVYTKDNFTNTTPVISNYANIIGLNTYPWTIPNDQSATVKLRLADANDATNVFVDSAQFTIDLYQITFELRDLLTNNHIAALSANGSSSTGGYTWVSSVSSPVTKGLQAGAWSVTFTKTGYADGGTTVVADSDKTVVLFMETNVVHVWESITDMAYNSTTDTVALSSTLRRDGITVSGATSCAVNVYDGATLIKTFSKAGAPDTAQGFYSFTWAAPSGLVTGKVYNVVTTIVNATGGSINTPRTFHITEIKKLQDVQDTINTKLDIPLSQVRSEVRADLKAQLGFTDADLAAGKSMKSEMTAQTAAIDAKLVSFEQKTDVQIAALQAGAADIKTAAGNVEMKGEDLEATNLKFSGRLMMPRTVLINDKDVKLVYQAIEGIVPLITITAPSAAGKDTVVVENFPMARSKDRADTYEYTIDKVTSPPYTPGKFVTVLVEAETFTYKLQPLKGKIKNVEVGSFIVESTTLSTLEGLVAGSSGVKGMVADVLTTLRGVQSSFSAGGDMTALLETLNRKVDALPSQIAQQISAQGDAVQMRNTLNEVANQIRALAGDDMGLDFSRLIGKALDESSSITDIRKKADSVQGTTEVMQVLMEQKLGGIDAPVVHVVYQ